MEVVFHSNKLFAAVWLLHEKQKKKQNKQKLKNRVIQAGNIRSSCPEVFCKRFVFKNITKFTGESGTLLTKTPSQMCFFKNPFFTEQLGTTAYESDILCHWSRSISPLNIRNTLKQFVGMQVNTGWIDSHTATEYLPF